MILAGDIGGTKTLLALYRQQDNELVCDKKRQFASADFETFEDLLVSFLGDEKLTAVCIGVAGPVQDGVCNTTNLPWLLRTADIAAQTTTDNVMLLNDLEATAWGILNLPDEDFVDLNPDGICKQGNIAVLAAGTGLGEAMIAWDGQKHHVIATEGGHTDFAPNDDEQIALLKYFMKLYPRHVSYERLVSGEGLVNIYGFLKTQSAAVVSDETESLMQDSDPAAVISAQAISGKDGLCANALALFCRVYGAEAGNLALKCLPYGGVVLAGGIAAKILLAMRQGGFMQGFLAKGRYRQVLAQMSVRVCTNPEAALLGAAHYALKLQ